MGKGKMVICVTLLVCTLCFLGACNQNPATPTPEEKTHYEFQGIRVGDLFSDARETLGMYENRIQEDAALTTYMYSHFFVVTTQTGDQEVIISIVLRSNAVTTEEEVAIGDTREKVIEAYGEDFVDDTVQGQMIYVKKDTVLTFLVDEEGVVLSITYSQISEE